MTKSLLAVMLISALTQSYAQVKFERGYYEDHDGNRVECLIKSQSWVKNPKRFQYKSAEGGDVQSMTPGAVSGFGIYNSASYVSATVDVDRSPSLSNSGQAEFQNETLFLKVLVEGKASLYYFEDKDIARFFFRHGDSRIEQLIYKQYRDLSNKVFENARFRQQLWNDLNCQAIERKEVERLTYDKRALVKFFTEYNSCAGAVATVTGEKVRHKMFALNVRPRLNYSSFNTKNTMDQGLRFELEKNINFGIGLEVEVFPVKNTKWALIAEGVFQRYRANSTSTGSNNQGTFVGEADYRSVEIPFGLRYYFLMKGNSRLYLNASVLIDFVNSQSHLKVSRLSGYPVSDLPLNGGIGPAVAVGYKYDKFGIEVRYQPVRDPTNRYLAWESEFSSVSMIVGYNVFRR